VTDSQVESLITFYSSVLVSGARNFATGVKNRCQFSGASFWSVCHGHKLLLITNRKSHTSFRLVSKLVTLNGVMAVILRYFR